jgi:hypothetical protein
MVIFKGELVVWLNVETRNDPSPFLSVEEENVIADYLSEMALRGMGLGPADVMDLVQTFFIKRKKNPLKNNRPGYTWYYGFLGRHTTKLEIKKNPYYRRQDQKLRYQRKHGQVVR